MTDYSFFDVYEANQTQVSYAPASPVTLVSALDSQFFGAMINYGLSMLATFVTSYHLSSLTFDPLISAFNTEASVRFVWNQLSREIVGFFVIYQMHRVTELKDYTDIMDYKRDALPVIQRQLGDLWDTLHRLNMHSYTIDFGACIQEKSTVMLDGEEHDCVAFLRSPHDTMLGIVSVRMLSLPQPPLAHFHQSPSFVMAVMAALHLDQPLNDSYVPMLFQNTSQLCDMARKYPGSRDFYLTLAEMHNGLLFTVLIVTLVVMAFICAEQPHKIMSRRAKNRLLDEAEAYFDGLADHENPRRLMAARTDEEQEAVLDSLDPAFFEQFQDPVSILLCLNPVRLPPDISHVYDIETVLALLEQNGKVPTTNTLITAIIPDKEATKVIAEKLEEAFDAMNHAGPSL